MRLTSKLLGLPLQDGTVPMLDLADQVGLSATSVWKRIQTTGAEG